MVSVTLSVPPEVKKDMERFDEINWSGFIRKAVIEKTKQMKWREQMLKKVKEEEPLTKWAVETFSASRMKRLKELRKKGLI